MPRQRGRPTLPERCLDATKGEPLAALSLAVEIVRRRELEKGSLPDATIEELAGDQLLSELVRLERDLLSRGVIRYA